MPHMTHWSDRQYYDVAWDAEVARISGFDDKGMEHWIIIKLASPSRAEEDSFRARRNDAVALIMEHIEAGNEAGEVK